MRCEQLIREVEMCKTNSQFAFVVESFVGCALLYECCKRIARCLVWADI